MTYSAPTAAKARVRKRAGVTSRTRRRAGADDSTCTETSLEKRLQNGGITVGAAERRRPRAEEERPVGRVQEHRHEVGPAQVAEDARCAGALAEGPQT